MIRHLRHVLAALALLVMLALPARAQLTFSCEEGNDVYRAIVAGGARVERFDTAADAVDRAAPGSGVLILANGYPKTRTNVDAKALARAREKKLRLYIEFPQALEGIELGEPRVAVWERAVVATGALGNDAPKMRILAPHACWFLPTKAADPLLVLGRVAGFDNAVYGLPRESVSLLFRTPAGDWVATTKLSNFVTARYAPQAPWVAMWKHVLAQLDPHGRPPKLVVEPLVRPAYDKTTPLPKDAEAQAVARFARWIDASGLLISPQRDPAYRKLLAAGVETTDPPARDEPAGDGSVGILEGFASQIRHDGTQLRRTPVRADCQAESAMVLALHGSMSNDARSQTVAKNLLDFVYFKSPMHAGVHSDPKHPAFGLIAWGAYSRAWEVATYGDDNARTLLATMLAAASLKSDAWDEPMLKALLANLRTTGKLGFRGDRIDIPQLERHGWRHFHNAETVNYGMNFEAYLWACYLWAYHQTGERAFLDKARTAIHMTMNVYPKSWRWADNMERARILLPLAWLVRVEDTAQHREWLTGVTTDLLKMQDACGAIRENLGGSGGGAGHYVVPATNEAYGTTETPLIQRNGDPVSDQLYTTGFALLGLHEAAAVMKNPTFAKAADELAEYLLRIQVRAAKQRQLDGSWFRAFDFGQWDYWASSADIGWGAWSVEAGWGPAWIAATLALRERHTSLWEMTADSAIERHNGKLKPLMAQ